MKLKISKDIFQIISLFWFVWLLNLSSCLMQLENLLPLIPTHVHRFINMAHLVPICLAFFALFDQNTNSFFKIVCACDPKPKLFHVWGLALPQWMSLLRSLLISLHSDFQWKNSNNMNESKVKEQKVPERTFRNTVMVSWNLMRLDL